MNTLDKLDELGPRAESNLSSVQAIAAAPDPAVTNTVNPPQDTGNAGMSSNQPNTTPHGPPNSSSVLGAETSTPAHDGPASTVDSGGVLSRSSIISFLRAVVDALSIPCGRESFQAEPTIPEQSPAEPDTQPSDGLTWPEAYPPSKMRGKVLEELKGKTSVEDVDDVLASRAVYYDKHAIRFDLSEALGVVKGTLMLRALPTNLSPRKDRRIPRLASSGAAESACFYIVEPQRIAELMGGIVPRREEYKGISLGKIIILAYTIAAQVPAHINAEEKSQRFLDAMWEGVRRLSDPGQNTSNTDGAAINDGVARAPGESSSMSGLDVGGTLPSHDLERGFGEKYMRFRSEVFAIKERKRPTVDNEGTESVDLLSENRQLKDKLRRLDNRVEAARKVRDLAKK